jgi:hypothetical protein
MAARNSIAKYSRHGWQLIQNKLRIYHQGGLDSYCQFYAIFNLINFLHFKTTQNENFIGENDFTNFLAIVNEPTFKRFFPETPFGGEGVEAPTLIGTLYLALEKARLKGKARIEEDVSIPLNDKRQNLWLRIGVEQAFTSPYDVLGLAQVHEEEPDLPIGHCVVFIGKNHLENTEIDSKDWDGIVLDSDRDYLYWRKMNDKNDPAKPCIEIERSNSERKPIPIYWISSFISVSVA